MKIFKVMMLVFGAMFFPLIASAEGLPANPWLTQANKGVVLDFQRKLEGLNPGVRFCLLHLEQISLLNELGKNQDFEILNCWTQSTYDD